MSSPPSGTAKSASSSSASAIEASPLDAIVQRAVACGLLPPDAAATDSREVVHIERPWPVVFLTAAGAWLVALPLLTILAVIFNSWVLDGSGAYSIGAVMLIGATITLRNLGVSVFFEQLAFPVLLTGLILLFFAVVRDIGVQPAATVVLLVSLAVAALVIRLWLRVLLGAAAATLFMLAIWPTGGGLWADSAMVLWLRIYSAISVWIGFLLCQSRALGQSGRGTGLALLLEPLACGWLLAILLGVCALSGQSFLLSGAFNLGRFNENRLGSERAMALNAFSMEPLAQTSSALLALIAHFVAQRAWPILRQLRAVFVTCLLAFLCWFVPLLGCVVFILAITVTTGRQRQAAVAALVSIWLIGSFYYLLAWSLTIKALVLLGCGACLGALSWGALRAPIANSLPTIEAATHAIGLHPVRWRQWLLAFSAIATLAVVNVAIAEKEDIIANGQKVYVPLIPADPRSLMQGDYMRLRFSLPALERHHRLNAGIDGVRVSHLHAVGRLDERNVVVWERIEENMASIAQGEVHMQLSPQNGDWVLVTDGWHFREGDAKVWEQARFGEFRVQTNGTATLVGMADAHLSRFGR